MSPLASVLLGAGAGGAIGAFVGWIILKRPDVRPGVTIATAGSLISAIGGVAFLTEERQTAVSRLAP